jgi:hypothetical protein
MFLLILLAALAVVGIVGTLRALPVDGYRRVPTDPSRLP